MFDTEKMYHGFKFTEKKYVEEIKSDVYIGEHVKSGAKIVYVASGDDNKVFSISFKTVPENDTGVMHILEHSVLNGSDKYPVREPFVELLKGSMQTFLNAMTYPDKTMYPVASCNEKDFENLMDVYLDAVFHPAIYNKKEIFLQEGWHYEGGDQPCFRGVVYNEMKGEMSSEDSLLGEYLQNTMFPDLCYSKNSGGDPEAIPSLTYEEFIETHKKFYHPSNSYIYLYGNMDAEEKLRLMDEGYLSAYDRVENGVEIGEQKDMGRMTKTAPYDSEEDKEGATHYAMGFKAGSFEDHQRLMAIDILLSSIASNNESPLKKALLDRGICQEFWAYLDDQIASPYVSFTLKRCGSDGAKAEAAVESIIKDIIEQGIDKEVLEANINQAEFKMREADFGNMPAGLIYCTWVMASWLYGGDPTLLLTYEKEFDEIREKAKGNYFEELLQELFIDSPHSAFVTLTPDSELAKTKEAAEKARVEAYREKLGDEGVRNAEEELKKLETMQNAEDTPENLAKIPVLDLKYISRETEKLPLEKTTGGGFDILFHEMETKKILYMTMFFDLGDVDIKDLPYISFGSRLIGKMGTDSMTAGEVINKIKLLMGSFGVGVDTYSSINEPDKIQVKLRASFSALEGNICQAIKLAGELITKTDFSDESEIKKMLLQEKLGREAWMTRSGHSAALRRVMSYFSKEDRINQILNGVDYYFFIKKLTEEFDPALKEKIENSLKTAVNRENAVLSVAGDKAIFEKCCACLDEMGLESGQKSDKTFNVECSAENEGFMLPTDVSFVAKGANCKNVNGSMFVLSHIMTYDYLWNTIRAKGGAYGTGFTINLGGDMGMYSYRDPNLKNTVDAFDCAYKYLEAFDVDNREMTKYIVGAVASSDKPKSPFVKAMRASSDYFTGIDRQFRNKIRGEMIDTTAEDIRSCADIIKKCMDENMVCVFSSKGKIEKNSDLFKKKVTIK